MNDELPRVGGESTEHRAVCVYSLRPGEPQCGKPATMHLRTYDPAYGAVALATCTEHLPIARAAGEFLQEHTYDGWCGFPASLWNVEQNVCLIDATGIEPARHTYAEATS